MHRGRLYNRKVSYLKARRKMQIDINHYKKRYGTPIGKDRVLGCNYQLYYNNLHQYSKNKVHCSCSMCSAKTRNKGNSKLKGQIPSINWRISDKRKIDSMNDSLRDFEE